MRVPRAKVLRCVLLETKLEVCLLINFRRPRHKAKRIVSEF